MKKFIIAITSVCFGILIGLYLGRKYISHSLDEKEATINKLRYYFRIVDLWLSIREKGKKLDSYFISNNYNNIAVYGIGKMGNHLIKEMKKSTINISYGIDKNANIYSDELVIYAPDAVLPQADVIVVSAVSEFDEIKEFLQKVTSIPVVSLEEVLFYCM